VLTAFGRAFKTPDPRRKILFTLSIITLYRLGAHVPTPGVSYPLVQQCISGADNSNGLLGLVNLFSGGALLQLSIFALGIMPYITASIIVQLLTVVIPRFEALKKEGQAGQTKMTQYTRYLTIALAVLQSSTLITFAQNPASLFNNPACTNILSNDSVVTILIMVLTMTAGTGVVMWMGELITDKGIGNGMSLLIFTSIAAGFPASLWAIQQRSGWDVFIGIILMGFVVISLVVFVEQSQRRIPVQYAKRMVGRRVYGGTSTYIPLKVNMAGVIPVIFASSLMIFPTFIFSQLKEFANQSAQAAIQAQTAQGLVPTVDTTLFQSISSFLSDAFQPGEYPYVLVYIAMVYFFSYFWITVQFNPEEMSKQLKEHGSFIPGLRPGPRTAEYLETVMNRITYVGAGFLAALAVMPTVINRAMNIDYTVTQFLGGTGLLIVVSVTMDFLQRVEANLLMRNYSGFLGAAGEEGDGPKLRGPRF